MKSEFNMKLSVNIDRIVTIRQARMTDEPDPVYAAMLAEMGGADGIAVHLRRTAATFRNATWRSAPGDQEQTEHGDSLFPWTWSRSL